MASVTWAAGNVADEAIDVALMTSLTLTAMMTMTTLTRSLKTGEAGDAAAAVDVTIDDSDW